MADHISAAKRNRQGQRRAARAQHHIGLMRRQVKLLRAALGAKDGKLAVAALRDAVRSIDRAAGKGVVPRRTASRSIARLTRAVNQLATTSS